ncbi:hypothetical protein [Pseudomonas prosekii]|nr:hypothetical protein [Pseudomonas prosekii]
MKRDYLNRELGLFMIGAIAGMSEIVVFLALKKSGYETLSWVIMASSAGMIAAAYAMSRMLKDIHALDEEEQLSTDSLLYKSPNLPASPSSYIPPVIDDPLIESMTFPYATKALEAARQATLKFWIDYDPERPPLQKSVQSFIAERGIPARQAAELASAIKPDNVSDRPDTSPGK